jgi:hypothetical protein
VSACRQEISEVEIESEHDPLLAPCHFEDFVIGEAVELHLPKVDDVMTVQA